MLNVRRLVSMACGLLLAALMLSPSIAICSAASTTSRLDDQHEEQLVVSSLQAAQSEPQQDESYQRVYEAFTKLIQNVSNNSLSNARRLVSRLNQLVGPSGASTASPQPALVEVDRREQRPAQPNAEEDKRTEQILQRLDQVNKQTDQHTLSKLQEDVNRLVGSLSESYLRNVRRVIERVNKTIGSSSQQLTPPAVAVLHQSADRLENGGPDGGRQPGFPGWDELITAVDRMQKSLANFVRSSTKLITAGRR